MVESKRLRAWGWSLAVIVLLFAHGCSGGDSGRASIHGAVTLDGKPLEQGAIKFVPLAGTLGVVTGTDIKNGRYTLPRAQGAAVGMHQVEITATRKTGQLVRDPYGPPGSTVEKKISAVAPRFNSMSTLTFDVQAGDNQADFEVASE